ncbi:hypothetical protein [Sphingopyxis panaciterrae]
MNALTPPLAGGRPADRAPDAPAAATDRAATELFWGLQYCRATTLSLTRLELAMESGDRQRIIEAIDRLHALDGEIERKVASLPGPAELDPARTAIEEYLGREKMAVAFEKLVLASGISGPGIASPPAAYSAEPAGRGQLRFPAGPPDLGDAPPFAVADRPGIVATYGPKAALLLAIVAATGAILAVAL